MSKEERRGIVMRGRERRREMEKGRERITRKENSVLPNWEVGVVGNFSIKGQTVDMLSALWAVGSVMTTHCHCS